jgi:hypothetical protein
VYQLDFPVTLWQMVWLALWLATAVWAFFDARKRGRPALSVAIMVGVAPVFGLLIWLALRPDRIAPDAR